MHARGAAIITAMLLLGVAASAQYVAGDYGSWTSGTWGTAATWRVYDGSSWATSPTASSAPNANNNVFIRGGTVVEATFGTVYHAMNVTVEATGRLYNNNTGPTNLSYISIYGTTLKCDGYIGNNPTLDGISFNIEGTNVTISGSGQFEAARIRKTFNANPVTGTTLTTTNLLIDMDVTLRFSGGTNTMIYNNFSGSSTFNLTINSGRTVTLSGVGGNGNVAVDGVDGLGAGNRAGTFTVNGTLYIPGTLYLTTDNASPSFNTAFVIGTTGYVRCNIINASASGTGATPSSNTLTINNGGVLEIVGTPTAWTAFSTTNNVYSLQAASRVIYSGAGSQDVRPVTGGYGHLRILGSGTKALSGLTAVKGDMEIQNTTGTPILDVTLSNFQLNVAGNWTNYAASGFNERSGIVNFNSTTAAQTVTTSGGEAFYTWQFTKSTSFPLVTMGSDVSVTNSLALNTGAIELNGNLLAILNSSTAAISTNSTFSTIRHIRSERTDNTSRVRWDIGSTTGAHVVPFGTPSGYTPLTFNLTAGTAGSVTMALYGTPANNTPWPTSPVAVTSMSSPLFADNTAAVVDRFWEVDVTGTPTATLTFAYRSTELPATPYDDPTNFRAQRWNGATQQWEGQLSGTSSAYSVVATGVTAFGPFALSPVPDPLPVELLRFDAQAAGAQVDLTWTTASERNSAWFTVERSADLLTWTRVAQVAAAGSSQHLIAYSTVDPEPLDGWNYYRLVETDQDGTSGTSTTVAVLFARAAAPPVITAWPNPAHGTVQVQWEGALDNTVLQAELIDGAGRVVRQSATTGAPLMRVDLEGLPAGVYLLRMGYNDTWRYTRLAVQ